MLDSKSWNTSLLEVRITSKNEHIRICEVSKLIFQIIFDAWLASINVGLKRPIAWNKSRHASSWQFYLHSGSEETGNPGIIRIICHQLLCHPSEHGTSSMGKHFLDKAQIAKLNKFKESDVAELTSSMVNETALAMLRWQGSWGITIVSSQRKFILDLLVWSILTELTDKTLQPGSKELWNFWISPRHMELLPHVRICFSSYSMECYIKSQATTVLSSIMKWRGAAVRNHH